MALTKIGKEGITGISNASNATAITIDASENVGIGVVPESSYPDRPVLRIGSGLGLMCRASGNPSHTWINSNCYQDPSSADEKYIGTDEASQINQANGIFSFKVAGSGSAGSTISWTTAMTIDNSGNVLVGKTSGGVGSAGAELRSGSSNYAVTATSSGHTAMLINRLSSTGELVQIRQANTQVGSISVTASNTAYNTSSDYRLKENIDYTWDATTRLKQLKPARFNFIADDTNTLVDGFIAHEVSSIVPEAITGTKDAMTAQVLYTEGDELPDGKSVGDVKEPSVIKPQGIDQSKLVPLLVKTIQELEARLTAGGL